MRCFFCGGVWHPATGSLVTERVRACGPCTRHFVTWFSGHVRRRWGKKGSPKFYDAAFKFKQETTPAPTARPSVF